METSFYVDDRGTMIGIKIADGTYIPILDESEKDKKKVILTTVRDEQSSVQIDLYRGTGSKMADPQYLDSLKIDSIGEALKGEPEIELVIGVDEEDRLIATAKDLKGDNEKSFEVDLAAVPAPDPISYNAESDFDLSSTEGEIDFSGEGESKTATPSYSPMNGQSASIHEGKNRRPLLILAVIALLIAAGVLCWFFLLRGSGEESVAAQPATPPVQTPAPRPAAPAPVPQPPAPAAAEEKKPGTGVWYSIIRGDNLWNLSKSFYRTPWRFKKIAEENNIRNPDLIYAGNRIYIPDVETRKKP
jgi:hypothetical protein